MNDRILAALVLSVLATGIALRLLGAGSIELWADEAMWATRLAEGHVGRIRPIGYMALTGLLLFVHNSEFVLRSLSVVAGIAQLPLTWLLLRRILTLPGAALLATWMLALHPVAIAMSKEFKPYALESCLHTAVILLALVALETRSRRALAGFVSLAIAACFLSWSIAFAFPAAFALLALQARREARRADARIALGGATVALGILVVLFAVRSAPRPGHAEYWGDKYDVFYTGGGGLLGRSGWMASKTLDIAAFPGRLHLAEPAQTALAGLVVLCVVLGLAALAARRQWPLLALLTGPWVVAAGFNAAGLWPYGVFRTNTFLLVYALALFAVGLDALAGQFLARGAKGAAVTAALALLGGSMLPLEER